ncbi:MAG TPA: MFS transporter [Dermatophilaceae bacterium]|nr:MFS transporter [Dermatophilaceae bacterium]
MTAVEAGEAGRLATLRHETFSALSIRNFRLYFAGQSISMVGTWMQMVAQAWLVLEITGSATWVGLTFAAQTLPILLVGPYGGLVADRTNKRSLLVALQVVMGVLALVLSVLTLTDTVLLWQVLGLAALLGLADAFEKPTRQSFLVEIVGPESVRNAVSLNSVMVNAARVLGPAVAGLVIAAGGLGVCFALNAASFVPVVLMLLAMDASLLRPAVPQPHERGQVRAGFAYVRRERELGVPLLMMAIMGCFTYEFQVTLPYLARTTFDGDSRTYGFMTAAMGLGAVLGGLYTAARGRTGIRTLVRSSILFGVLVLATALAPSATVALVLLVAVGAASVSLMARGNATLQLATAPEMRGRVMALWLVAFLGTTPLGGPVVGWVSSTFGARWGLVLGAAACFVAAAVGAIALSRATRDVRLGAPGRTWDTAATASGSRAEHISPHDPEH